MGLLTLSWIEATDSHTGVGMGGFAMWVATSFGAAIVSLMGLVLMLFRDTRRVGTAMVAGGLAMLATLLFSVAI